MTDAPAFISWINKGTNPIPDWLTPQVSGRRDPNGTFLIRTRAGKEEVTARVLVGHIVVDRAGVAYTRLPGEMREFLAELEKVQQIASAEQAERAARMVASASPPPVAVAAKVAPLKAPAAKPRTWPAPLGRPPSIENRHPDELLIDDSYQRSIDTGPSRALIERIARGWDWRMCMPLVVSKRESGHLYVIDGQHRLAGAKLRGDIQWLPCCVAVYASVADEAAMFTAMNRARRAINRLDDFHAAQASGDEETLAIAALIEGVGFTVSRRTGSAAWAPGEVAFTSTIRNERRRHGDEPARSALQLMAEAFPDQRLVAGSSVFTAICAVLASPPEHFDTERLRQALHTYDMKGWASFLDQSRGGSDRNRHLREMLLVAYDDLEKRAAA